MRPSIDEYFLGFARQAATRATCLRKKVGAVITREGLLLSSGYNGSIRGMPHCTDEGVGWTGSYGDAVWSASLRLFVPKG